MTNTVPFNPIKPFIFANKVISFSKSLKRLTDTKFTYATVEQVHGDTIAIDNTPHPSCYLNCDGIITTQKNKVLLIKHADCLPIFISHPSGITAALHAGRKGTELGIFVTCLKILKEKYAIQNNLEVFFGPAICESCYQINRETDLHYDLLKKNTEQLYQYFSPAEVFLNVSKDCTVCNNNLYFSYRKEGKGVQMNWSGIKT